jgi:probable phosphoglycerate mutase
LGRTDLPLDAVGELQAQRIAAAIGRPDRLISSPLLRTRQTAAAFGMEPEIDDRFIEVSYGDWEGRPVANVSTEEWVEWRANEDFAPPAGESLPSVSERVSAALDDLAEQARDELVVVVTHVSPIRAGVLWTLRGPSAMAWHLFVAQASITRMVPRPPGFALSSFGEVGHLEGLGGPAR